LDVFFAGAIGAGVGTAFFLAGAFCATAFLTVVFFAAFFADDFLAVAIVLILSILQHRRIQPGQIAEFTTPAPESGVLRVSVCDRTNPD
jgi:hypothetical protein